MYSPPPRLKPPNQVLSVDITEQAGRPVRRESRCIAQQMKRLAWLSSLYPDITGYGYYAYFQTLFSSKVYFLSGNLGKLILSLSGVGWWLLLLLNHQKNWLATSSGWQPLLQYYRLARNLGRGPPPCASTSGATFKRLPTILSSDSHWQVFRMGDPQEAARFLLLEEEKLEKRSRRKSFFSLGRAFITALIFVWLAWLTLDTKGKFLNLKLFKA